MLVYQGIVRGETYRFRYRALNAYGWGPYSEISYIIAAQTPGKAQAPIFVSATNTSLTVNLNLAVSNGGLPILSYVLEINDGTETGSFS